MVLASPVDLSGMMIRIDHKRDTRPRDRGRSHSSPCTRSTLPSPIPWFSFQFVIERVVFVETPPRANLRCPALLVWQARKKGGGHRPAPGLPPGHSLRLARCRQIAGEGPPMIPRRPHAPTRRIACTPLAPSLILRSSWPLSPCRR